MIEYTFYESKRFRVRVAGIGLTIYSGATSAFLQGEEAGNLQNDISKLEDKWADNDTKREEFTDYLLSQYM